jgi:diguanylate cyclase (GGDEF)-like protein
VASFSGSNEPTSFRRALDCLPDGVLLINDDRSIAYANPAFAKVWNIPDALMRSGDEEALLNFVTDKLVDPVQFVREVERLYRSFENSEDELLFKDGKIVSRRSVPLSEHGQAQGRIWIFTDVTEARHASMDFLTGLPNRRAFAREFPASIMARADGLVRSVAIMDVDNFKSYNDIYGHAAGDAALRQIGSILRSNLTNSDDLVYRIGGEEFLIACRSRRRDTIVAFFEELRRSIQSATIDHSGNPPHGCVTASIGLALFRGPKDPDFAFKQADAALYEAKARGRNRMALALPDPADFPPSPVAVDSSTAAAACR